METLRALNRIISQGMLIVAGLMLTAMMLLACANMTLRAFGNPVQGTYELMGFMGAVVIAFSLAGTQLRKGHIALMVLQGVFQRHVERGIDALSGAAGCAFFSLVGWRVTLWAHGLASMGEYSETLRIPYYPFAYAVAAGCFLLALTLLLDFLEVLLGKEKAP